MPSRLLFISDLHLESSRPDITAAFLQFLQDNAGNCEALYILGDLFEVWIGDDDASELNETVAVALRAFQQAGSDVFIMHGNRDFLIGEDYAALCHAKLIDEPLVIATTAGPLILLHGDVLCTDDVDYMRFRDTVRRPEWQQEFLARTLEERRAFAAQARQQSQAATRDKAAAIMDVNQAAVLALLQQQGQLTMLHGHTHRPAVHDITLDPAIAGETRARRIVLGDWDKDAWFVEIGDGEIALRQQSFPA